MNAAPSQAGAINSLSPEIKKRVEKITQPSRNADYAVRRRYRIIFAEPFGTTVFLRHFAVLANIGRRLASEQDAMAKVTIGTSGWHYDSWRGPFYPAGLPLKAQLQYYASQFESVELNGVFYRTPSEDAVRSWRADTGKDFVFTWKASKFITHWRRLTVSSANSLALMEQRMSLLGDKAGPVLFQLPPNFACDSGRLADFLALLPGPRRYSFEFRHPSWYTPAIFKLLREHNAALCLSDHHDAPAPWRRTADFVYVRGHGPGGRYEGSYSTKTLRTWATHVRSWKKQGSDVFVYFDNDQKSVAPFDAFRLRKYLAEPPKASKQP